MRIKLIEKWKFALLGRSVPVVKLEDINEIGQAQTIHLLGRCGKRGNSIISPWDSKGWEINPSYGTVRMIDEKGLESRAYVVSESGSTVPVMTRAFAFPNKEDVIGRAATLDDIADSMDLHKSIKFLAIGLLVGLPIGALILGPMLQIMVS